MRTPKLCTHRRSGRAYVTDPATGRQIPLGVAGTPEAERAYRDWLAARQAAGPPPPGRPAKPAPRTVDAVAARYLSHAADYYRKRGRPTSELLLVRLALAPLVERFGTLPAAGLTPGRLKELRDGYVARGWSRGYVNDQVDRVRRCWRWAVESELAPAACWEALKAVAALKKGRSAAKECPPVAPVGLRTVWDTLPWLAPHNALLVQLHLALACRAGEVVLLRPCDLDRSAEPWAFAPSSFKTEHLEGRPRQIFVGPLARRLLGPLIGAARRPTDWLFPARPCGRHRGRPAAGHKTVWGYRAAVAAACRRSGLPRWCPRRLRHTAGTLIRERFGLDAAQFALGHTHARTTEIYAARSDDLARRVAEELG